MGLSTLKLLGIVLSAMLSFGKAQDQCTGELASTGLCLAVNSATCANCGITFSFLNPQGVGGVGTCDQVDTVCSLKSCCPECVDDINMLGDCYTGGQQCPNEDCANVEPTAPSPASGIIFPTLPPADNGIDIPPECGTQFGAFNLCFLTNVLTCAVTCDDSDNTGDTGVDGCDSIEGFCQGFITCCPPCEMETKELVSCVSQAQGCTEDCDSFEIQPVTPSPAGGINFPTLAPGEGAFPPECGTALVDYTACFFGNLFECGLSCDDTSGSTDEFTCDSVDAFCQEFLTCCPQCADETKAIVSCGSLALECGRDCDDVSIQPVAPSPVVLIPTAPSPGGDNFPPECGSETAAFTSCFFTNVFECGLVCEDAGGDDEEDFACEDVELFCQEFLSCCPRCAAETRALVACGAQANGCSQDCDNLAPVTPGTPSPVTLPPGTPPVDTPPTDTTPPPTTPSPVTPAPVTPAPVMPKVTSSPEMPSSETPAPVTPAPVMPKVTSSPEMPSAETPAPVTAAPSAADTPSGAPAVTFLASLLVSAALLLVFI